MGFYVFIVPGQVPNIFLLGSRIIRHGAESLSPIRPLLQL